MVFSSSLLLLEIVYAWVVFVLYAQEEPGNQNLLVFNLEIEANAQLRGGEVRRKRALVVMTKRDYALP